MKLSIVTSFGAPIYSLEETIKLVGELNYEAIDIMAFMPHADPDDMDSRRRSLVKELMNSYSLKPGALATAGVGITDFCLAVREASVQYDIRALDLAVDLGFKYVEALGGWAWHIMGAYDKIWEVSVKNMKRVVKHAEDVGVTLAIEFEPAMHLVPYNLVQLKNYIDDIGSPYCKANFDMGHCNIRSAGVTDEQIRALRGYIVHAHINDNDGEHDSNWLPGFGTTPYEKMLKILDEIGYNGYLAVEMENSPRPKEWAEEAKRYLENLLKKMNLYG